MHLQLETSGSRRRPVGRKVLLAAAAALLLFAVHATPAPLNAQRRDASRVDGEGRSSIRGMVLDGESGQPVASAYLFLHPTGRAQAGKDISSDADGAFFLDMLPAGSWVMTVSRAGYRIQSLDIVLEEGKERDLIVYLQPRAYETGPVIVTGSHTHSRIEPSDELTAVLRGRELEKELGSTLGATLKDETGIAMRAMGPAPARPVIRGLGGDRVVMSEDGAKSTDLSASSPDHAVTIEPFAVERIEVLRGPMVLTKSPSTLGGIVNVVRHEVPQDRHSNILGAVGLYGETANRGGLASAWAELPIEPVMLRAEISGRGAGDMRSPEGRLSNSDAHSLDYSAGISRIHDDGFVGTSYRDYSLAYGVPGGFVGAHPNGVDIELERRQVNVRGMHVLDTWLLHDIRFHASRAYYRHKEFEASGAIGSEFRIVNWAAELRATHHSFGPVSEGMIGVDAEHRDFAVGGFVFTMPSASTTVAPYLFERLHLDRFSIEAALRYTWNRILPDREKPDARIGAIRERRFDALSASMTVLYELTDIVHLGANISRSNRMPTIEELYSEGPHLAAYSYETGNPDLDMERGYGAELFLRHRFPTLSVNVNLFRNVFSSFIIPRNTGEINYSTFLPIYATEGVAAELSGAEMQVDWQLHESVDLDASLSYTHGTFVDDGTPLPQVPPLKGSLGLSWRLSQLRLGAEVVAAASQDRVDRHEDPTAGYAIVNASAQYSILGGTQVHNVSLVVENLLDQPYRNHLSRVKVILPEAGINVRLTYKWYFDF